LKEGEEFGILRLKTPKANITTKPTMILFNIDSSISMDERNGKGIIKIDVVKTSFKNMILYLSKLNAPIYIAVYSFNDRVETVLEVIKIDETNVMNAIESINNIKTMGSTNIESVLKHTRHILNDYQNKNPNHQIAHIFMTDGHPTAGLLDADSLNAFVSDKWGNVFIGFGNDHNLSLLKRLSDNKNSYYQFINEFENTACVYGELMFPYLYPCVENATIFIHGGLIYNWKKNLWVDRIDEDVLYAELEKIYHVRKTGTEDVIIDIYGINALNKEESYQLLDTTGEMPHLVTLETNDVLLNDLTAYMFRQKTQEILYKCIKTSEPKFDKIERDDVKKELKKTFDEIRQYMKETEKMADPFLKQLCDDLYVSYTTFNTGVFEMATLSRHTSQGRQQTNLYTPVNITSNRYSATRMPPPTPRKLYRSFTCPAYPTQDIEDFPDTEQEEPLSRFLSEREEGSLFEIDNYQMDDSNTSCYATQTVLYTMSQMQNGDLDAPTIKL
jgi:hypothetical protein